MPNELNEAIWKDAERYRFLRDEAQYAEGWTPHVLNRAHLSGHAQEFLAEEELDEAIDEAMARLNATQGAPTNGK